MSRAERVERIAWIALLLVAAFLHLYRLTERPFHHDESVHGWFSWRLAFEGDYKYDPVYHGPVQYYAVATAFRLLGDSDLSARLPAALGGVALVALAFLLRERFGKATAFASGALLAVSPVLLYYTRFCREDVWSLLGTAGTFLFLERWLRTNRVREIAIAALFAAVAFASKENFYVLLALLGPSAAFCLLEPGRGLDLRGRFRQVKDVVVKNAAVITAAVLLFFVVSELFYTVFLTHPDSGNPAWEAIRYWWGQHKVARVGGPRWYHLPRLLQYEFAILLPAIGLSLVRWKRFGAAERFLFGWGVLSIGMYAFLGEKTPWLIVHQTLPFVPLAGRAFAWAFRAGVLARLSATAIAAAGVVSALSLSFWHPVLTPRDEKAESVIFVQTSPEMHEVVKEILSAAASGASPAAAIQGESVWPLEWYLRHVPVDWGLPSAEKKPAVAIVDPKDADEAAQRLGPGYVRRDVPLRVWWLPEIGNGVPTLGQLGTYLFRRIPWSPIGSQDVVVFTRSGRIAP